MSNEIRVLVVEDDATLREAICDTLQFSGYQAVAAPNGKIALDLLAQMSFQLVVSDVQMDGIDGHQLLKKIKSLYAELPVVLITAYGSIERAVEAMQNGAADYLVKPFEAEVLIEMVSRVAQKRSSEAGFESADPKMKQVAELALRVANTDATVLISGESGTGKEVMARMIHNHSPRVAQPFIAVNCAAIPESMLESMLFGYERGAYTGAHQSRAGKFEQANGGTLLLDEISEMDLGLQAKLLRVLQEKEVERLGGSTTIPLDVRVLATTNRQLREEVAAKRFREDLFYRLNVFPLHIPPLRERPQDILPLAKILLGRHAAGELVDFSADAQQKLRSHSWPGNVRELENTVQRAVILKTGNCLAAGDIQFENALTEPAPDALAADAMLEGDLKAREQQLIVDALRAENGSRKEAAARLGISPRTLRYKLARLKEQGVAIPAAG